MAGTGNHAKVREVVFYAHAVSKSYQTGDLTVVALRSVELKLSAGEFIVILGPSGSGKSTLLNILGGLDCPTSGDVRFRDHWLAGLGYCFLILVALKLRQGWVTNPTATLDSEDHYRASCRTVGLWKSGHSPMTK